MKKLMLGLTLALLVAATSVARAQCCGGAKAEGADAKAGAKMTCPCMCVQGITLTDEQKAKVDALQAKCKDGCPKGCCKACKAELKTILTEEQFAQLEQNCKACKKDKASCCPKKEEAPKQEEAK